jgi:hypothetical protein
LLDECQQTFGVRDGPVFSDLPGHLDHVIEADANNFHVPSPILLVICSRALQRSKYALPQADELDPSSNQCPSLGCLPISFQVGVTSRAQATPVMMAEAAFQGLMTGPI